VTSEGTPDRRKWPVVRRNADYLTAIPLDNDGVFAANLVGLERFTRPRVVLDNQRANRVVLPNRSRLMPHASLCLLIAIPLIVGVVHVAADRSDDRSESSRSSKYVEASEQLVVEIYVQDVKQSAAFYEKLGFKIHRQEQGFVELGWEDSRLFLEQIPGQPAPPKTLVANIRIMVPDVDHYWKRCGELKLPVVKPIADRYYGLRDFTVVSPDGVGLRFATTLRKH
jgi:catechol 2,3-dioxygenase-like lactoylglutathione lyase family enzyme